MANIGDEPAHYTVFEFHGAPLSLIQGRLSSDIATTSGARG